VELYNLSASRGRLNVKS